MSSDKRIETGTTLHNTLRAICNSEIIIPLSGYDSDELSGII